MAENREIAWRAGESTKIEGWVGQTSIKHRLKIVSKTGCKHEAEHHQKVKQKISEHGVRMGANTHKQIIENWMIFLDGFRIETIGSDEPAIERARAPGEE